MIVVADTSPLNYLVRLGCSEVLQAIYGQVLVPPAVLKEMRHAEAPVEVRTWALQTPAWLILSPVEHLDQTLATELGAGEREAISLALLVGADTLLIDDRAGRIAAEKRSLRVQGTLSILFEADRRGMIDFPASVTCLREVGFRVSPKLQELMIERHAQSKNVKP